MPKIVDHDQRRAEIIMALWTVIAERGIEGASLQAVARTAGISVGRIQHYFASKDELVRAGCQFIVDLAEAGHTERTRGSGPWETLTALLTQPIPATEERRLGTAVWYAYMARAVIDPGIGEIMRRATRGAHEEVRALLVATGAPPHLATPLLGLSAGLTQHVLMGTMTAPEAVTAITAEVDRLRRSHSAFGTGALDAEAVS